MKLPLLQLCTLSFACVALSSCSESMLHQPPTALDLWGNTKVRERSGGGLDITIEAGNFSKKTVALEGFRVKARKKYKTGSYAYQYNIQQTSKNRWTSSPGIPQVVGPSSNGALVATGVFAAGHLFLA